MELYHGTNIAGQGGLSGDVFRRSGKVLRGVSGYVYRCVGKCEMSESHGFKTCLNTAMISFAAM